MTDEQILKRLAEIEGWSAGKVIDVANYDRDIYGYFDHGHRVDPLTNWSDLGPLIEKYQPDIVWGVWDEDSNRYTEAVAYVDGKRGSHDSLPHAICLAIIEANGGMGDE